MSKTIAEELFDHVNEAVQRAILENEKQNNDGGPGALNLCGNTALACLTTGAMIVAKKPFTAKNREEFEENPDKFRQASFGLVTPETLLYTALVAGNMCEGINPDGSQPAELGPHVLGKAIEQWEKLFPDKNIEDHILEGIVKAGRTAMLGSVVPFQKFLDERKSKGFIVPGNGSVN